MNKIQKTWLRVFITMFAIPELLFSPVILIILSFLGLNINPIMFNLIGEQFFTNNPDFILLIIIIEIIGLSGLWFFNIKFNKNKYKIFISILLPVIIIALILLAWLGHILAHMKLSF